MSHLSCPRCATHFPIDDYPLGCYVCAQEGFPANLQIEYATPLAESYRTEMPYTSGLDLGEGDTPLLRSCLAARLHLKLECENPTGSHKDRMAAIGIARAIERGAKRVVAASSGNAGIAIANYASAAGISCEIAITKDCSDYFRQRIIATGATLVECADSLSRWHHLEDAIRDKATYALTNYTLPAVGSPSIAIEGYKPIAWEIFEHLGRQAPNFIFVPVARGDLLVGIARGFQTLRNRNLIAELPRLIAVEPFARLSKVIAGGDYRDTFAGHTQQFSTAGSTVTFQTIQALEATNGLVRVIGDEAALNAQRQLADDGLDPELCAAATLAAYHQCCADGTITSTATTVLIITGSSNDHAAHAGL
jgi:threonine synthase